MPSRAAFERNAFVRDFARSIVLNDARRTENAAVRARLLADVELNALLVAAALRRGQSALDWPEYFRNMDVAK